MKRIKHIICLLAVALAGSGSLNGQGLGFYLGGKRVELVEGDSINFVNINPAKRNVLDLKNETCKNREKRNVLKISHTRHYKITKKQSKTGCFYSF